MRDTKQKILQAATTLFAGKGLEGVSVREISRKAGVNLAAINYHFQSKEQLYMEIFRQHFHKLLDNMQRLEQEKIEDEEVYIRRFVQHQLDMLFHRDREMELIIARELSVPSERRNQLAREFFVPVLKSLVQMLQRGMARRRFRKMDPALVALSLVGMCVFYCNKRDMLGLMLETDTFSDKFGDRVSAHTAELLLKGLKR